MASASSQVVTSITGNGKNARQRAAGTATFPTGASSCTVENVPYLSDKSIVKVIQVEANGVPLLEKKASRVTGTNGTMTIATKTGGNTSQTVDFAWVKEEP